MSGFVHPDGCHGSARQWGEGEGCVQRGSICCCEDFGNHMPRHLMNLHIVPCYHRREGCETIAVYIFIGLEIMMLLASKFYQPIRDNDFRHHGYDR